jgi:hypothetical protein
MSASTDGSLIPAVKAAVVLLLTDAEWPALRTPYSTGLPRPLISYTETRDQGRDRVIIGDSSDGGGDQEWFTFQPSRLEEFELAAGIVSEGPGLSAQETTERAFAMFNVFARVLLTAAVEATPEEPALGIAGMVSIAVRQPRHTDVRDGEGYMCVIDTGIRVQGWVAPREVEA